MSNSSDSDILVALEKLECIINHGILKVDSLLKDAWNNEDLKNIKEEISQSRKKLEVARNTLQQSLDQSAQVLQVLPELKSTSSSASEQRTLLNQACHEGKNLYSSLKSEEIKGRDYLNNLVASRQEYQQYKTEFDEAIRRIKTAGNILSELDRKYGLLFEIGKNVEEIINRVGGYKSISDLVVSIREATERLQEEQIQARTMIEEFELIKHKVDDLIQAHRAPWWWPRYWWWKKKIGFTVQRIK